MPELPEVETLVRHLRRRVVGERVRDAEIFRPRSIWRTSTRQLVRKLVGQRIRDLTRRAKYLRFDLENGGCFLVHLGMTGRLFVVRDPSAARKRDKHDVAHFHFADSTLVFHDPRKFGHMELGEASLHGLGPEPFDQKFSEGYLAEKLGHSRTPIKVRLLDQKLVAGLGNIYASEVLWRARIDPRVPCHRLGAIHLARLRKEIIATLRDAIRFGGGLSLNFDSPNPRDGLFYYGSGARRDNPSEHFDAYDREGKACRRCRTPITRTVQGGRSTFFCPRCQKHS